VGVAAKAINNRECCFLSPSNSFREHFRAHSVAKLPQQLTKDTFQAALRQAARQPPRDCHAPFSVDKQQI